MRHTALQLLQVLLEAWRTTCSLLTTHADFTMSVGLSLRRRMPDIQTVVASHAVTGSSNDEVRRCRVLTSKLRQPCQAASAGPLLTSQLIRVLALLCELFPDKEVLAINVTKLLPAVRTHPFSFSSIHMPICTQAVGECSPLVQASWLAWQRGVLLPADNATGRRQCALFLHSPAALVDVLQLAATAVETVQRAARFMVTDVLESSALFQGATLELQLWLAMLCGPSVRCASGVDRFGCTASTTCHSRAARSFFAEAVSTTLRKPFDAWQASLTQQPAPPVSLVALTALRQSLLFVGSAKQDADDKAAVANTLAGVFGSLLSTAGTDTTALARVVAGVCVPTAAVGKKRGASRADGLPAEAAALAQLLQTVETLCSGAAKRRKKRCVVTKTHQMV